MVLSATRVVRARLGYRKVNYAIDPETKKRLEEIAVEELDKMIASIQRRAHDMNPPNYEQELNYILYATGIAVDEGLENM